VGVCGRGAVQVTSEQLDKDYEEFTKRQDQAKQQKKMQDGVSSGEQARKTNGFDNKKAPLKEADIEKLVKWAKRRMKASKEVDVDDFESDFLSKQEKLEIVSDIFGGENEQSESADA
jgi:hypothetical protein